MVQVLCFLLSYKNDRGKTIMLHHNMATFARGAVVLYKPTRKIFAVSSGSWTGNPAQKERPCVITFIDSGGGMALAPFCGAHLDYWKRPNRRAGMDLAWWMPLDFSSRLLGNFPVPPDGLREVSRSPLAVPVNKVPTEAKRPFLPVGLKPSYLWSGDPGEVVYGLTPANTAYFNTADFNFSTEALTVLTHWNNYWRANKQPPA